MSDVYVEAKVGVKIYFGVTTLILSDRKGKRYVKTMKPTCKARLIISEGETDGCSN
jgi:hypothetical protein